MASHMDGINALPKWDRNNPTSYSYDPANYNAADYAAFKQARMDLRAKQFANAKAKLAQTLDKANKDFEKMVERDQAKAAGKGATLHADLPSSVFASLSWKDGVATAEFFRGGAITYDYEMEKDDFLDWALSDSLGKYFNEEVR